MKTQWSRSFVMSAETLVSALKWLILMWVVRSDQKQDLQTQSAGFGANSKCGYTLKASQHPSFISSCLCKASVCLVVLSYHRNMATQSDRGGPTPCVDIKGSF